MEQGPNRTQPMDAGSQAAATATAQHRVDVLRRAYRVLKADYEKRDYELSAERAAHATTLADSKAYAIRAEAAERELKQLKEIVHERAIAATTTLSRYTAGVPAADTSAPDNARTRSMASNAGHGSYNRGMVWADRVLSSVNSLSAALSTSTESVSSFTLPPAVQAQLNAQEECLESHKHMLHAMQLEVAHLERALVVCDGHRRHERDALEQTGASTAEIGRLEAIAADKLNAANAAASETLSQAHAVQAHAASQHQRLESLTIHAQALEMELAATRAALGAAQEQLHSQPQSLRAQAPPLQVQPQSPHAVPAQASIGAGGFPSITEQSAPKPAVKVAAVGGVPKPLPPAVTRLPFSGVQPAFVDTETDLYHVYSPSCTPYATVPEHGSSCAPFATAAGLIAAHEIAAAAVQPDALPPLAAPFAAAEDLAHAPPQSHPPSLPLLSADPHLPTSPQPQSNEASLGSLAASLLEAPSPSAPFSSEPARLVAAPPPPSTLGHDTHAHDIHAHDIHAPEMHVPGMHVPEMHARGMHVHGMHVHGMHAHEMHAHEMHAHEMHAHEMHAHEMHAHEMHARDAALKAPQLIYNSDAYAHLALTPQIGSHEREQDSIVSLNQANTKVHQDPDYTHLDGRLIDTPREPRYPAAALPAAALPPPMLSLESEPSYVPSPLERPPNELLMRY